MQTRDTVVGVFHDRDDAQDAINALRDAGFAPDDISVLARDRDQAGALAEETGTEAGTGAATGALTGGLLGGVAGWLVGISALVLPGIGPIAGAAIIAPVLAGAVVGRFIGGPGEEAATREEDVLLTVHAGGERQAREARSILERAGATDTRVYRAPAQ